MKIGGEPARIRRLKKAVRERDGMRCTNCHMSNDDHRAKTRQSLHVHRLVPGSTYDAATTITLCGSCHKKFDLQIKRPLRVDSDIARMLSVIALATGQDVSAIVSPHLRKVIPALYREALKKLEKEVTD